MNFNDDDSILYQDDSRLRPPPNESSRQMFPGPFQMYPGNPYPQGSNLNVGPPPNFTPSKDAAGVKSLNSAPQGNAKSKSNGPQTKAVSPGSISFCLFKFTYIWERSGRSYWAFLLNADRKSISGLRWFRGTWVYFGVDINKIDSFVCYRGDSGSERNIKKDSLIQSRKEYKTNGTKDIYVKVLSSIEVPEERNEFLVNYLGEVDGNDLTVQVPCKQRRTISYRIVLEVKYPENFNKNLIDEVNEIAIEASKEAINSLDSFRDSNKFLTPLEVFNTSTKNIGKTIKVFSEEFTNKLKKLKLNRDISKQIEYSITEEKIEEPWRVV